MVVCFTYANRRSGSAHRQAPWNSSTGLELLSHGSIRGGQNGRFFLVVHEWWTAKEAGQPFCGRVNPFTLSRTTRSAKQQEPEVGCNQHFGHGLLGSWVLFPHPGSPEIRRMSHRPAFWALRLPEVGRLSKAQVHFLWETRLWKLSSAEGATKARARPSALPDQRPKAIVSINIAESSLTVEGICIVVDMGSFWR